MGLWDLLGFIWNSLWARPNNSNTLELIPPPVPPLRTLVTVASSFTCRQLCPLPLADLRLCLGPWNPQWGSLSSPLTFPPLSVSFRALRRPHALTPARVPPSIAAGPWLTGKLSLPPWSMRPWAGLMDFSMEKQLEFQFNTWKLALMLSIFG
jgi:hypothetical protein